MESVGIFDNIELSNRSVIAMDIFKFAVFGFNFIAVFDFLSVMLAFLKIHLLLMEVWFDGDWIGFRFCPSFVAAFLQWADLALFNIKILSVNLIFAYIFFVLSSFSNGRMSGRTHKTVRLFVIIKLILLLSKTLPDGGIQSRYDLDVLLLCYLQIFFSAVSDITNNGIYLHPIILTYLQ